MINKKVKKAVILKLKMTALFLFLQLISVVLSKFLISPFVTGDVYVKPTLILKPLQSALHVSVPLDNKFIVCKRLYAKSCGQSKKRFNLADEK